MTGFCLAPGTYATAKPREYGFPCPLDGVRSTYADRMPRLHHDLPACFPECRGGEDRLISHVTTEVHGGICTHGRRTDRRRQSLAPRPSALLIAAASVLADVAAPLAPRPACGTAVNRSSLSRLVRPVDPLEARGRRSSLVDRAYATPVRAGRRRSSPRGHGQPTQRLTRHSTSRALPPLEFKPDCIPRMIPLILAILRIRLAGLVE